MEYIVSSDSLPFSTETHGKNSLDFRIDRTIQPCRRTESIRDDLH
jgi:hypothetical protein